MSRELTTIALYLPQFHPIPENDRWWGRGFTEWTNTAKAKPLFRGHYQPHVPADLGFYDLRVPEVRAAQAELARSHGVDAFCYYHYWFGDGRRLLERPFDEVLRTGQPDFPFCICWANETWTGIWHGAPGRVLIEQTYPGDDDWRRHFEYLATAFHDPRYVRVDGLPLLVVYRPKDLPDVDRIVERFRDDARRHGLPGLHLVGWKYPADAWDPRDHGFDSVVTGFVRWRRNSVFGRVHRFIEEKLSLPTRYSYEQLNADLSRAVRDPQTHYPCLVPNWDNTPRSGFRGYMITGATPEKFRVQVRAALQRVETLAESRRILFVKSWNEWAEGNHLEPDLRDGRAWLEALRDEIASWKAAHADQATRLVETPAVSGERRTAS